MRIRLNQGDSVTAVMSASAATSNPYVYVEYHTSDGPRSAWVQLNGATAVTLLSGGNDFPIVVDAISLHNNDTASITFTLSHVQNAVSHIVAKKTLNVDDTLTLDQSGLRSVNTSGQFVQAQVTPQVVNHSLDFTKAREATALATNLPATATGAFCGLITGTYLTSSPSIQTSDSHSASTTQKFRIAYEVPEYYQAGQAITIRFAAGMVTTVSDTSAALTCQVVRQVAPTVNICPNTSNSINSLTSANFDYALTATNVVPGDVLDIVVQIAIVDGATGTAVIGTVTNMAVRPTVRV